MEEEELENHITGYPKTISFNCTETIIEQMRKNICLIKIGKKQGTGFFCEVPFPDKNNMLKVLMTNNHIINEEILYKCDLKISIYIEEEKKYRELNLNNRIKYTNKKEEYDITIIEIKEEDEIKNFLELDKNILNDIINNENENDKYIDKTFYVIQYPEGELSVSYGIISNICEDKKYKLLHKCSTKDGSSGSPILTLENKIIGIHAGGAKLNNYGTLLNYPIKDFINQKFYNNIIDERINEIFLKKINYKFKLEISNANITNFTPIKKYLGDDGFAELKELYFYYKNKILSQFLNSDFHKKVIEQMKKCICFIITKNNSKANGFFCRIPFPDKNNMLKVLITVNHLISEEMLIREDLKISIYIEEEKKYRELNLNNRIKYTNMEYDITIIEIKEEDKIDNNYLELNDKILNDIIYNTNEIGENFDNDIYLIQHSEHELFVSFGVIEFNKEFNRDKFIHFCKTDYGSSGSPILDLNNKVLGIHLHFLTKRDDKNKKKIGQFLNGPIKEFIKINYKKNEPKELLIDNNYIKNEILIQDNQIKWNLINKIIGKELLKELDNLVLSFKKDFEASFGFDSYEMLLCQVEEKVYKIKIENKDTIGFFCVIPLLKEDKIIFILITNNSIINEDILKEKNAKILIEFQKEKKIKGISLTNRKIYTSKVYNTTIIEIKKEDEIYCRYLELDERIINIINGIKNEENLRIFDDEQIYMINNQEGNLTSSFSKIKIKGIYDDKKYDFIFRLNKNLFTNGAPIFISNNKLIGIANYCRKHYSLCEGTFINFPIKEFLDKNYQI